MVPHDSKSDLPLTSLLITYGLNVLALEQAQPVHVDTYWHNQVGHDGRVSGSNLNPIQNPYAFSLIPVGIDMNAIIVDAWGASLVSKNGDIASAKPR